MISFGIYKGKELRICLECKGGLLIADIENTKTQEVYCINCGTLHTYKRNKKTTTVRKLESKCSEEKMLEITRENKDVLKEAMKQIAMMDEVIRAELKKERE